MWLQADLNFQEQNKLKKFHSTCILSASNLQNNPGDMLTSINLHLSSTVW